MSRFIPLPWFAVGVALGVARVFAAETSPILKEPAAEAAATPIKPAAPRVISSQVAGLLAAATPKYAPPEATPAKPTEAELQETDKPRNGIIRLPRYIVRDFTLPAPNARDMLTARGELERALARYPGLRLGLNNAWARAMGQEDLALERHQEMWDLLSLLDSRTAPMPLLISRPWFSTPSSGPWSGLAVPWERK